MPVEKTGYKPGISIHAPREGSDPELVRRQRRRPAISIHAPREGSDAFSVEHMKKLYEFLSTLPARGATSGRAFVITTQ